MHPFRFLFRFPSKLQRKARRSRMTLILMIVVISVLLVGPIYAIYKPPDLVVRFVQQRWPDVLWKITTLQKVVALTIDDGPSEYTTEIMQILKDNDASATFFLIGSQIPGYESILRDLVRNGNELANHAMRDEPSRLLSDDALVQQIESVQKSIQDTYTAVNADSPMNYFRPGSGFFDTRMRLMLPKMGYQMVLGSVYPWDAQIPYWTINARHILGMVQPGSIIICHDRRSWTVPMLRKVIPELRRRGYRVVTVTEAFKARDM